MRDAPSLVIIPKLQAAGARIVAYDPEGGKMARAMLPGVEFAGNAYTCLEGADAAVVTTEWDEFRALDLARGQGRPRHAHRRRHAQHLSDQDDESDGLLLCVRRARARRPGLTSKRFRSLGSPACRAAAPQNDHKSRSCGAVRAELCWLDWRRRLRPEPTLYSFVVGLGNIRWSSPVHRARRPLAPIPKSFGQVRCQAYAVSDRRPEAAPRSVSISIPSARRRSRQADG